jgi:hypothetical protein
MNLQALIRIHPDVFQIRSPFTRFWQPAFRTANGKNFTEKEGQENPRDGFRDGNDIKNGATGLSCRIFRMAVIQA